MTKRVEIVTDRMFILLRGHRYDTVFLNVRATAEVKSSARKQQRN